MTIRIPYWVVLAGIGATPFILRASVALFRPDPPVHERVEPGDTPYEIFYDYYKEEVLDA